MYDSQIREWINRVDSSPPHSKSRPYSELSERTYHQFPKPKHRSPDMGSKRKGVATGESVGDGSSTRASKRAKAAPVPRPVIKTWTKKDLEKEAGFDRIEKLYDQIILLHQSRTGIFPHELKTVFPEHHKLWPLQFREEPTPKTCRDPFPEIEPSVSVPCSCYTQHSVCRELYELRSVVQRATRLSRHQVHECAWVSDVCLPLLRIAFHDQVEHVATAKVAPEDDSQADLVSVAEEEPEDRANTSRSSKATRGSNTKLVDVVVALYTGSDEELGKIINGLDLGEPPHVNQTHYPGLEANVIALSLEAKKEMRAKDPLPQLDQWTSAWHLRMRKLREYATRKNLDSLSIETDEYQRHMAEDKEAVLIPVPVIATVGHHWNLFFAFFKKDSPITLYGPKDLGSPLSIDNAYFLVAYLRLIQDWMSTEFKDAMTAWFRGKEVKVPEQHGGDENTGDENTGDENTGDENTGDENTGDKNTGSEDTVAGKH
ncbi:hypothetical protein F4680DRAFT_1602 [Xylaria scruposa]|nr:hypothetical protein F4680DRAFT_1602 [Xylaria scruposa]